MLVTPPAVVARSERPRIALAIFIAQELERWGFEVTRADSALDVAIGDDKSVLIRMSEWDAGASRS